MTLDMSCIKTVLCFLFLASASYLARPCNAEPVAAVATYEEPRPAAESSDTIDTYENIYPEIRARLRRRMESLLRLRAAEWPVVLKYWNSKFSNRQEACAQVERDMANVTIENSCQSGYTCDYDAARFPSTLLQPNCSSTASEVSCIPPNYANPTRGTCLKKEQYLTVVKFHAKQNRPPSSVHTVGQPPSLNGQQLEGKWKREQFKLTTNCFCKA